MKTFVVTPSMPRSYGLVDLDLEGGGDFSKHVVGMGEEFYRKRLWFFSRWFNIPFLVFQYSKVLLFRSGLDCILGARRIVIPEDAPTMSLNSTTDLGSDYSREIKSPSHFGGVDRVWNENSSGLCILLPGLKAYPTMFNELCEGIAFLHPNLDFFTPDLVAMDEDDNMFWSPRSAERESIDVSQVDARVLETGIYQTGCHVPSISRSREYLAQRHAERLMVTVRAYLEPYKGHPQKIILIGFSKGTHVQTFLDAALQRDFPQCRVVFISIAGVFEGTRLVDSLDSYGLGRLVGSAEEVKELKFESELCRAVTTTLKGACLANHEYDFFASTCDEYVWPFTSSLPLLPQTCRHHVFYNKLHNDMLKASTEKVKEIIKKFIE